MKKLSSIFTALGLLFFVPLQGKEPTQKIVILNAQKVFNDSSAYKDIQRQIEDFRKKIQLSITQRESVLRKEEATLIKLNNEKKLSSAAFESRKQAFTKKVAALQNDVAAVKTKIEEALQIAMENVRKNIKEVSEAVANAKGSKTIILAGACVSFSAEDEITEEVLKMHNQVMPTYKVPLPAATLEKIGQDPQATRSKG